MHNIWTKLSAVRIYFRFEGFHGFFITILAFSVVQSCQIFMMFSLLGLFSIELAILPIGTLVVSLKGFFFFFKPDLEARLWGQVDHFDAFSIELMGLWLARGIV